MDGGMEVGNFGDDDQADLVLGEEIVVEIGAMKATTKKGQKNQWMLRSTHLIANYGVEALVSGLGANNLQWPSKVNVPKKGKDGS